jgi:hypothetical protein
MSAWDPDKLEKRGNMFTEVADKVGKLAEAVADFAGLLDKGLASGQLAKSPSLSKASDMTAECLARVAEIERDLRLLAERGSSFLRRRPTGKWLLSRHIYG